MVRYVLFCVFFFSCFSAGGGLYFLYSILPSKTYLNNTKIVVDGRKEREMSFLKRPLSNNKQKTLLCYQGFLLQKQRNINQSDKIFIKIYDENKNASFLFKEEVLGGRILNAFFLEDIDLMQELIETLRQQFSQSHLLPLFEFLLHYKKKCFSQALDSLYLWKECLKSHETSLLSENIQLLLSDFFLESMEANCLIEMGEFSLGRVILNRIIEKFLKRECDWNSDIYDNAVLMLGRSYFLELQQSHSSKVYPDYYEMILFYKKKVHTIDKKVYEQFIPQETFFSMLMEHIFIVPESRLSPLLQIIENWDRFYFNPNHELVIQPLVNHFFSSSNKVSRICCSIVGFREDSLKKKLIDTFGAILSEKVLQLKTNEAQKTLSLLKQLDSDIFLSKKLIISPETLQEIIFHDDVNYTNLRKYLNLWEEIQSYDIDKQQLVKHLIKIANQLWQLGTCDNKALNLLRVILQFTNSDIESENIVSRFVKQTYKNLLSSHAISRLLQLEDFIVDIGLNPITVCEEDIANFIADAEFLYSQGKYKQSYLYSLWLTKIAPSPQTYRLLALCLVEHKCYAEAWEYFSLLSTHARYDPKVQKALALCYKCLSKDSGINYEK
ncbi:DUF1347 family protein [Chlamydia avium]|uniref:Uncharacterized protein n=1 Tax=Chlamydia avium 10DC88 TaxID=1229831 RepID=W8K1D1_9CHLA|nr:DUF1347 family protein [Chlamydia avium]AHK63642.1 Uncharacterized protein M832_07930 [Chlamydia avium 10DC88]